MAKRFVGFSASVAVALVVMLGVADASNQGVRPLWAIFGILLLPCLLIALIKFPAAFIVPLLFISRNMPLPINPYARVFDPTALPLGAGLLALAIIFRLVKHASQRNGPSLRELFKNQAKGIVAYFLFAAVVTISYAWTRAPNYGGAKLVSVLTVGTLCFLAPFVLMTEERDFRDFFLFTYAFALVLSLGRIAAGAEAVYKVHEDATHIGIAQLIGMGILLALNYKFFRHPLAHFVQLLTLPVMAAGLIAAESRGALFSLIFVLLGLLFARKRPMSAISPRVALEGVAVIAVLLLVLPQRLFHGEAAEKFHAKSIEVVDMVQGKSTDEGSGGRRLVFYQAALRGFAEKPFAGWGVGGWATFYHHNDAWEYPHFVLLEVGVEEGLLGLATLTAFLIIGLKAAKKAFDEASGRFAFVLPALVYCLLQTTFSGDIDDSRFLWVWCSMAFAACRIIDSHRQEKTQPETAAGA